MRPVDQNDLIAVRPLESGTLRPWHMSMDKKDTVIPAGEFKQKCLAIIDTVAETHDRSPSPSAAGRSVQEWAPERLSLPRIGDSRRFTGFRRHGEL